ncbi:MAG: hypothetical protein ACR2IJ_02320 [Fluviibacter sp.]
MKHKWHKEIKAWADGAEIEFKDKYAELWHRAEEPKWYEVREYRIKPQPKEPQYLYVYKGQGYQYNFSMEKDSADSPYLGRYVGKIKLEVDDV